MPEPLPHPDIPPPHAIDPGLPLWVWLLATAALLGLVTLVLGLLLRKPAKAAAPPERPIRTAMRSLKDLRNRADALTPADIGHQVSAILRRYHLERHGIPAPWRTTEELFPQEAAATEATRRKKWRDRFEPLAAFYDALAYAPLPATKGDALALVDQALTKLEEERLHEDALAA